MNILFLDYDGVVNTPMWDDKGQTVRYNFPEDKKVNSFQVAQWVFHFCRTYNYSIVVSSSWRFEDNYEECLRNDGLWADIKIVGTTSYLYDDRKKRNRTVAI